MNHWFRLFVSTFTLACCATLCPGAVHADGKISIYLSRMEPRGEDARRFSRASWGGGLVVVLPWYAGHNLVALTSGLELSNMASQSTDVYDAVLRETLEQRTHQTYGRFFLGGRVGPHGPGFLRPHVGAHLAFVWYGISTDIDIPNPDDPSSPNSKTLDSQYEAAFGYDVNAGIDLNISNSFPVEFGVRYMQSFNVPQQLGEGAVSVSPSYFQAYAAIGVGFDFLQRHTNKGGPEE